MTVASNPTRKPPSATVAAMRINLNSALVMLPLRKTKNQASLIYLQPVAGMLLARRRCCQGWGCCGIPLAHGFKDFAPLQFAIYSRRINPATGFRNRLYRIDARRRHRKTWSREREGRVT